MATHIERRPFATGNVELKRAMTVMAGLLVMFFGPAHACSPNLKILDSVSRSFDSADVVVLGFLESTETNDVAQGEYKGGKLETASFLVLEAWKGPHRAGTHIQTKTMIWNGNCGISVRNDPAHIVDRQNHAVQTSRTWLLYLHGSPPYEVTIGRSAPLNVGGANDLTELYKLTTKTRSQ